MNLDIINKTFSSLKHKNFRLFFIGQSVSLIGTWMHQTALSWLIYDITDSKLLLGLVAAIATLPMLFLSAFGGVIADRYQRKEIVIVTQLLSMFFAFILAALVMFNAVEIWYIILLALLSGIIFAIDMPVRQAFLMDIVGREDLMNAIALNSSIVNAARIIGPALAGIIMVKLGILWCFILNAISFLAVLNALFRIKLKPTLIEKKTDTVLESLVQGFNYIKQNQLILNLMILLMVIGVFGWSYAVLIPAIAKDIFHAGEKGYAMMVSANGIGALAGALYIAYQGNNSNKKGLVNLGIYLFCISLILLALCKTFWISLILLGFTGLGSLIYFSSTTTIIQSNVNDNMRGRVMGIWALVFGGMVPIGNIFAGVAAQVFGLTQAILIGAVLCLLITTIMSVLEKSKEIEASEVNA